MRIALDAMGSDNRPLPDIEGALLAAKEYGDTIILVGDKARIDHELNKKDCNGLKIETVQASEEILMHDKPSVVLSSKPSSSMHIAMNMVKNKEADAFVTMGNTGAAHAIATLKTLRRIPGVARPALTAIYSVNGRKMIFLDIGANADSKADWIEQFAIMGGIYAQTALKIANPRIATLSNGEEEGKGNQLTREAQEKLKSSHMLNYIGHIEPKEILLGKADVIVMDGFVGNIFLKTFEGSISYFTNLIRGEVNSNWLYKVGALLMQNAFRSIRRKLDTREIGGAPLLGVNGVVIIGHGGADAYSVKNAINQARQAVLGNTIEAITVGLAKLNTSKTE
jgi:glycerol-3-phosphate acyltransferase PlsX